MYNVHNHFLFVHGCRLLILEQNYLVLGLLSSIHFRRVCNLRADCFLGPPLWSSGQSSWLQIQRSGFDSQRYQIFWEIVGLERVNSASWVQLRGYLKENVVASVFKTEITSVGHPPHWLRDTPLSAKVGTNVADKRRSLGRYVCSQTQATEFVFCLTGFCKLLKA
jgi:hypothetical protein